MRNKKISGERSRKGNWAGKTPRLQILARMAPGKLWPPEVSNGGELVCGRKIKCDLNLKLKLERGGGEKGKRGQKKKAGVKSNLL